MPACLLLGGATKTQARGTNRERGRLKQKISCSSFGIVPVTNGSFTPGVNKGLALCLSYVLKFAVLSTIPGPKADWGWLEEHDAMATYHPRPWHPDSVFGTGPRQHLTHVQRARWKNIILQARRDGNITAADEDVGLALLKRLSEDGQCDPSHATLAVDARCSDRTVRRSLVKLKALGLVTWQRRIVRGDRQTRQTSNAYVLMVPDTADATPPKSDPPGGQNGRQTQKSYIERGTHNSQPSYDPVDVSPQERWEAQQALAKRCAYTEGVLLSRYNVGPPNAFLAQGKPPGEGRNHLAAAPSAPREFTSPPYSASFRQSDIDTPLLI